MTIRRRGSSSAVISATLAATALTIAAFTSSGAEALPAHRITDASASAHAPGAGAGAQVALHVHVAGCDHCSVQLQQAISGAEHIWSSRIKKVGSDHVATFRIPRGFTHGMSFVVRAPWAKNTDDVPNAVTAYAGHRLGSAISNKVARHSGRAAGCWSGTGHASKSLFFRVSRIRTTGANGLKVVTPLVYATRTMSVWKPFVRTFHGAIGNQDAFYCSPPS